MQRLIAQENRSRRKKRKLANGRAARVKPEDYLADEVDSVFADLASARIGLLPLAETGIANLHRVLDRAFSLA